MEQLKRIHAMFYEDEKAVRVSKECGCFIAKGYSMAARLPNREMMRMHAHPCAPIAV